LRNTGLDDVLSVRREEMREGEGRGEKRRERRGR
jgi:hypothetical protein